MHSSSWMIYMLIIKLNHMATGENIGYQYGGHYVQPSKCSDEEIMI